MMKKDTRYLRRVDGRQGHGWEVRVARLDVRLTKLFSDSTCGGEPEAHKAAIEWRDQQDWFRNGATERHALDARATKRPPATRYLIRRDPPDSPGWTVRVTRGQLKVRKMFSDADWGGEVNALQAARQWRDQQPWFVNDPCNAPQDAAAQAQALLELQVMLQEKRVRKLAQKLAQQGAMRSLR